MGASQWLRQRSSNPIRPDSSPRDLHTQPMESLKQSFDNIGAGILAGLLGTAVGFGAMTVWWSWANGTSFDYFITDVFLGSSLYKDSILTISVLFNVGVFWLALRGDWERFAKGLLAVIFVTVPLIIWYQSQAF